MKKLMILVVTTFIAATMLLTTGCDAIFHTTDLGDIVEKTYDFSGFTAVHLSDAFQYQITQSDTYSITVSAYQSMLDHLEIHQSGNTLYIGLKFGLFGFNDNGNTGITITMPQLNKLDLSGACTGNTAGFNSNSDFEADLSGASQLNLDLTAGKTILDASGASDITGDLTSGYTEITLSGASRCELTGSAANTTIEASGASSVNSPDFTMDSADVTLDGASNAGVLTDGTLNLDISGFSTLNYYGNPTLGTIDISGLSKLNHK
ncbi:MAG: GIN domain-containing protein [Dehalococcoidales bacterium]